MFFYSISYQENMKKEMKFSLHSLRFILAFTLLAFCQNKHWHGLACPQKMSQIYLHPYPYASFILVLYLIVHLVENSTAKYTNILAIV